MKVYIKEFGPIRNAEVSLAPMTIFTGDSNLGKSYVNYLMYYLVRSLTVEALRDFFANKIKNKKGELNLTLDSLQNWMNGQAEKFMRNFLNAPELVCDVKFYLLEEKKNETYHIRYKEHENNNPEELPNTFLNNRKSIEIEINDKKYETLFPAMGDIMPVALAIYFSGYIQEILFNKVIEQAFILPPARGAFVGENYTLKENISSSVGMYRYFLRDYDIATQRQIKRSKYEKQIEQLVKGKLITKEGKQLLIMKNGNMLPLSAAASSIKELSPFLYTIQASSGMKQSFCIEEPEAHLHPEMQIAVMDLLACCFSDGMQFQFTTHSDYIMQRVNQMIKLEYIRKKNSVEFKRICEQYRLSEHHCIKREDVKVYYFKADENGNVEIVDLVITEQGFPMVTFFNVVQAMSDIEDNLNNVIAEIGDYYYEN